MWDCPVTKQKHGSVTDTDSEYHLKPLKSEKHQFEKFMPVPTLK